MSATLSCENLVLAVPGRVLCRALTFAIEPGQVWAVLGRNGSGKTTLVHALAGVQTQAGGSIRLDGAALASYPRRRRAREVGLLLQQEEADFWGSVFEYVLLGRFARARSSFGWDREDEDRAAAALDAVGLAEFAPRRLTTLSGGERQRARIAQVLAQAPRYFLLDEPLQHLDLNHQTRMLALFRDLAREGACAVAMVLHDALWPGAFCSHALLLHDDGNALAGPAEAVLNHGNLERLYGCALAELGRDGGRYFVPHV